MTALYLQEKTKIIGMHPNRRLFARSIADYSMLLNAADRPNAFRNVGVWEMVGMTGAWSHVLGLYEFSAGWSSVADMISQTMKDPAPELAATYRAVESRRSGGEDEILEPLAGCPTFAELQGRAGGGILLVHDEVRVDPGAEEAYGAFVTSEWLPVAKGHGQSLIGLYRGALTDGLVIACWATSLEDYTTLMASGEAATWRRAARKHRLSWRQELWTAAPKSRFSDPCFDYGDRDIRAE